MDGDAGSAMREQQDWLLLNGYESDWYSLHALTFGVTAGTCCNAQRSVRSPAGLMYLLSKLQVG